MSARKPLALHTGHHTKTDIEQLSQENEMAKSTRMCFDSIPDELADDTAKTEWQRISKILSEMDIIGDLDLCNLVGYCNACSLYRKATEKLINAPLVLETEKGTIKNPLVDIQDKYAKQMRDFAIKAGLSVDTRLKYAALKVKKNDEADITDEFGNI